MNETSCLNTDDVLDDYVDGRAADQAALQAHVAGCASCARLVAREQQLRATLAAYGESAVPMPDEAFFDAALARAVNDGQQQQRNRWLMTGFGGAVAAMLAIWIVSAPLLDAPPPDPAVPQVTMALAEPRTVNLVFSSAAALADARVTILLPPGVELAGFAGRRQVSWRTSLEAGRNLLPLTLLASDAVDGELQAILEHGNDERTFRVRVTTRKS